MIFPDQTLNEVVSQFFRQTPHKITPIGQGHIHHSFQVKNNDKTEWILQRINTQIFHEPHQLMKNIDAVTRHIRQKAVLLGLEPSRSTLTIQPALSGELLYRGQSGVWRMFHFIKNSFSREIPQSLGEVHDAAMITGKFLKMLIDFPIETLVPPLPDFHNSPKRYQDLLNCINLAASSRLKSAEEEIGFIRQRSSQLHKIQTALKTGNLPWRVTHNDTKFENILFDKYTEKCLCLIDLDTVMPGSPLFDFGDALRAMANTAAEDEPDLSKVNFSLSVYQTYLDGYLSSVKDLLNPLEIKLLPYAPWIITLENGIRFLSDYLKGDVYYKTNYPEHNLIRTRTQLKLVADMEKLKNDMQVNR